jgi:hypothetical protein
LPRQRQSWRCIPGHLGTWRRRGARSDELLGDLGLALQLGEPERPVHGHHELSALQPLAHDGDDLAVGRLTALLDLEQLPVTSGM